MIIDFRVRPPYKSIKESLLYTRKPLIFLRFLTRLFLNMFSNLIHNYENA